MPRAAKTKDSNVLQQRINNTGILLFKGGRMNHIKNRNSVPQLSSGCRNLIDNMAINFVIEMTAAAVGNMGVGGKGRKVLMRKDLFMAQCDRGISGLLEDTRARKVTGKSKTKKRRA